MQPSALEITEHAVC